MTEPKTTAETTTAPGTALTPQLHGGALRNGGTNVGGPGYLPRYSFWGGPETTDGGWVKWDDLAVYFTPESLLLLWESAKHSRTEARSDGLESLAARIEALLPPQSEWQDVYDAALTRRRMSAAPPKPPTPSNKNTHMRNRPSAEPVLLSELSRACGVSRVTCYIWARAGEIPATFRGGRYEMDRKHLPRIVRERGRAPKAAISSTETSVE